MKNHWLDRAKQRLQDEPPLASDVLFERLKAQGMINENGEVTGRLHHWDAFLAITEVKRNAGGEKIEVFRCLKPVFGMPGEATIDIRRDSMVSYLREGKKVITAAWDSRLDLWKELCLVHLSAEGFIQCESADTAEDDVGCLPEFTHSNSGL